MEQPASSVGVNWSVVFYKCKNNTIYFNLSNDILGWLLSTMASLITLLILEFRNAVSWCCCGYSRRNMAQAYARCRYRHNWKRDTLEWLYGVGLNYHPYGWQSGITETLFGGSHAVSIDAQSYFIFFCFVYMASLGLLHPVFSASWFTQCYPQYC